MVVLTTVMFIALLTGGINLHSTVSNKADNWCQRRSLVWTAMQCMDHFHPNTFSVAYPHGPQTGIFFSLQASQAAVLQGPLWESGRWKYGSSGPQSTAGTVTDCPDEQMLLGALLRRWLPGRPHFDAHLGRHCQAHHALPPDVPHPAIRRLSWQVC